MLVGPACGQPLGTGLAMPHVVEYRSRSFPLLLLLPHFGEVGDALLLVLPLLK